MPTKDDAVPRQKTVKAVVEMTVPADFDPGDSEVLTGLLDNVIHCGVVELRRPASAMELNHPYVQLLEKVLFHDSVIMSRVASQYEGGMCPDCCAEIPADALDGSACENCGHVFSLFRKTDDGSE